MLLDDAARLAVQVIAIRLDLAGDDAFAESPRRLDEHTPSLGIERIACEQDAGYLGVYQTLHDDGHRQPFIADALMSPIGDGAFAVQRLPAARDRGAHIRLAAHAEDRFLLPGEAGDGSIFADGRRTHGDRA